LEIDMFHRRRQPFNRTLLIGIALMAAANVLRLILERHTAMPEDPRDAVVGLFYGLAIGCMLLGVWRMNRSPETSDRSCD
jgi:hypothetical protein